MSGSWKYQSEGVEDELMFVSGWDNEGQNEGRHRSIGSNQLSQGHRRLWGGRQLSVGGKWFGPRDRNKEIEAIEESKKKMKGHSYWPIIQRAGEYITEKDLKGILDNLKEKKLIEIVVKLINGEKVGFDCESGREWFKNGAFEECKKDPKVSSNGAEVKSVLKSVVPNDYPGKIPIRRGFGSWRDQHYEQEEWKELYKSYDFEGSKVLNEKCEPDRYLWFLLDTKLKIRQEVCDLII